MKKNLFEILITPIVIALVGCLGTYLITRQQIKSSELHSRTQLESTEKITKSDQQIKIIEIFSEKITSEDIREREIAVRVLSTLDPNLASKLIDAIAQTTNEDTIIRNVAKQIIKNESAKNVYPVIGSYIKFNDAKNKAIKINSQNITYEVHIYLASNGYYALCLGGKLSMQESQKRVKYALSNKISKSAYSRRTDEWKENLLTIDY